MSTAGYAGAAPTGRTERRYIWRLASLGSRLVMSSWLIIAFGVGWEIWSRWSPSLFVPTMGTILSTFADVWLSTDPERLFLSEQFWTHASASLTRAGLGWSAAAAVGIAGGVILGVWKQAAWFFDPLVRFGVSTPSTIFLPVAILIFGITSAMNIFLIAFGVVWVILINTLDGVRSLNRTTVLTARSLRLGKTRYLFKIVLPGASPPDLHRPARQYRHSADPDDRCRALRSIRGASASSSRSRRGGSATPTCGPGSCSSVS